jgi:calcium permeable stress-gated cation channel
MSTTNSTQFQINAFWASLGTSIGFSALLALLFCFVRPRHTLVYAPKTKHSDEQHAPPPMGKGLFSWIGPVTKAKENVLVDKIGLDAVIFLRFARMLRNIFVALGLIGLLVMIPVNVTMRNKGISGGVDAFAIMTPLYVFGNGLWSQVVCAWAFDIIVCYFLWHNYQRVRSLRRDYFESREYQLSLHARTLIVRDLPSTMRSDEGILRVTDEVNPTGVLPRTTVGRNVRVLPDLIEEHEEHVKELESVLAKYLKDPDKLPAARPMMKPPKKYQGDRVGGKVDAIQFLTDRIRELEQEIREIRDRVDKRDTMPYGFASWDQIEQAHTVAFAARKKKPQGATVRLAPRPNELIWGNLHLTPKKRKAKKFVNALWVTVLTLLWMPLNAAIAIFLSNLSNLGSVWPGFQRQLEAHSTGWSIIQGIASPAITSLVYLVLPIIFRRLQIRAGDITKTSRERHVLRNLYLFFTLNNLVVFSLFSAVWQYVTAVIAANKSSGNAWDAIKDGKFFLTVTTALCQISPFWITWLLQRNLGAAIDLAQLWTLVYVWFSRSFMAPTPRQNIAWTAPPPFDYASYYNYFLFYSTVALCFSTLQPIVLIVTALYFTLDCVMKKYLLMYVFITKTESGGQFWRTLFNRMVFALALSNVLIGVVVKARGTWTMAFVMLPLLFGLVGFKWYCVKTFDLDIKYYVRTGMMDRERLAADTKRHGLAPLATKFGDPALYKPLITPMVHAKARHVLEQVYRGRLDSEGGRPTSMAFSDVAMEPMTQNGKPKQNAPFEIVPEGQQDFSYYKNRSDFREDGGPEDLVSERSRTPKSFLGGAGYSEPPSRESSPGAVGMHRKPYDVSNVHSAFSGSGPGTQNDSMERLGGENSDLGLRHGPYTDPYDDRTNLLRGVGDIRTPNGEFMPMDRWRTGQSGRYGPVGQTPDEEPVGSYDYFRERTKG